MLACESEYFLGMAPNLMRRIGKRSNPTHTTQIPYQRMRMLKAAGFDKALVRPRSCLIEVPEIRQGVGQIPQRRAVRILGR